MADEDDAFLRAWDRIEESRLNRELSPVVRALAPSGFPGRQSPVARAEQQRVRTLLGNDRAYRAQEAMRVAAEQQVESGEYTNIRDSVSAPTPEQFAHAERSGRYFRKFTPRGRDGTVRTVTAYRRQDLPQVQRMVLSGVIDGDGLRDCIWYRNLWEAAGLAGNIGSIDYGREVFSAPHSRTAFTEAQIDNQDQLRFVRRLIAQERLQLLDLVVLEDFAIWKAVRRLGRNVRRAKTTFAKAVEELHVARSSWERMD